MADHEHKDVAPGAVVPAKPAPSSSMAAHEADSTWRSLTRSSSWHRGWPGPASTADTSPRSRRLAGRRRRTAPGGMGRRGEVLACSASKPAGEGHERSRLKEPTTKDGVLPAPTSVPRQRSRARGRSRRRPSRRRGPRRRRSHATSTRGAKSRATQVTVRSARGSPGGVITSSASERRSPTRIGRKSAAGTRRSDNS